MANEITEAMKTFYNLNMQLLNVRDNVAFVENTDVLNSCFVAMVGPPGRGKSGTLQSLCDLFSHRLPKDEHGNPILDLIKVFNAGDVRREFEQGVKAMYENGGDSDYIENLGFSPDVTAELTAWAEDNDTDNKAIPGSLFGKVSVLNEIFAQLCWSKGMEMLSKDESRFVIFDATNTNCPRRDSVISDFQNIVGEKSRLLFIENICTNQEQIFKNYMSKLTASTDYRHHYGLMDKTYPVTDDISHMMDTVARNLISESRTVHNDALAIICTPEFPEIVARNQMEVNSQYLNNIVSDIRDIFIRDLTAYQVKYVPMHSPCGDGKESTVQQLNENGHYYVQNVNLICSPTHKTIINTNVQDKDVVKTLAHIDTDMKIAVNYDSGCRYKFERQHILDEVKSTMNNQKSSFTGGSSKALSVTKYMCLTGLTILASVLGGM